jgi:hypothetical protein
MAKAGRDSTTQWIPLHDGLEHVIAEYGSNQRAKELLEQWLGEGRVRWSSKYLEGPDEATVAKMRQEMLASPVVYLTPSTAYSNGDPRFWLAGLEINWEENWARERYVGGGTSAYMISVWLADMQALLPTAPTAGKKGAAGKKRSGPQVDRAEATLKKLYPPDGKVPDDVPTKRVQAEIAKYLAADSKNRGLGEPSWDTVKRALGRCK